MLVYDIFSELMASQNGMEQGTLDYNINRNEKKNLSLNLLKSEIL
jgi:hypothetical protein